MIQLPNRNDKNSAGKKLQVVVVVVIKKITIANSNSITFKMKKKQTYVSLTKCQLISRF
jgi:hypothetical protein